MAVADDWRYYLPVLLAFAACCVLVIVLTDPSGPAFVLDYVDGFKIFGVDDAWRYFSIRQSWDSPDSLAWSYILPGQFVLDGILAFLVQDALTPMRYMHGLAAGAGLYLLFRSALRLGVRPGVAATAAVSLALMPLFVFVALSFYGESWLTFWFCLVIFTFVHGHHRATAAAASVLPLIRPEGLLLMLPVALSLALRRRWWPCIICFIPGFLYLLYLMSVLGSIETFFAWRLELRQVLNAVEAPDLYRAHGILSVMNVFWLAGAAYGIATPAGRRLWPLWTGGLCFWAIMVATVAGGESFLEARYFVSLLPALTVLLALGIDRACRSLPGHAVLVIPVLIVFVLVENLGQLDVFRATVLAGNRWPINSGQPELRALVRADPAQHEDRAETARVIERFARARSGQLEAIVVTDTTLFYHLDPDNLPRGLRVTYGVSSPELAYRLYGGSFAMVERAPPHFAYITFSTILQPERNYLLATKPFCNNCVALHRSPVRAVYVLGGEESAVPGRRPGE